MAKRNSNSQAVSVFAASIVIAMGLGACALVAALLGDDLRVPMWLLGGGLSLLLLFQWLMLRSYDSGEGWIQRIYYAWALKHRKKPELDYQVKVIRPTAAAGSNRPPTVAEIRELKENPHTWIPKRPNQNPPA